MKRWSATCQHGGPLIMQSSKSEAHYIHHTCVNIPLMRDTPPLLSDHLHLTLRKGLMRAELITVWHQFHCDPLVLITSRLGDSSPQQHESCRTCPIILLQVLQISASQTCILDNHKQLSSSLRLCSDTTTSHTSLTDSMHAWQTTGLWGW